MFRILFFVVATLVAVSVAKFSSDCMRQARTFEQCCKNFPKTKMDEDANSECAKLRKPPPSCDTDICLAKKYGFASTEDGKFDKVKLLGHVQSLHEDEPEFAMNVIDKCVNGDLSGYGPPDLCDLMKFKHCFFANLGNRFKWLHNIFWGPSLLMVALCKQCGSSDPPSHTEPYVTAHNHNPLTSFGETYDQQYVDIYRQREKSQQIFPIGGYVAYSMQRMGQQRRVSENQRSY